MYTVPVDVPSFTDTAANTLGPCPVTVPAIILKNRLSRQAGRAYYLHFDAACVVDGRLGLFRGKNFYLCAPGENAACQGPLAIEGRWGKTASGQLLTGPFDAAISYQGRTYLFQGDQFFVSTPGEDTQAQGPHPIKSYWGSDNQEMPLDGPFDAVTLYADRLYIRKGELYWDQPVVGIKALN